MSLFTPLTAQYAHPCRTASSSRGLLPQTQQDSLLHAADLNLTHPQTGGDLRLGLVLKIPHTDQLSVCRGQTVQQLPQQHMIQHLFLLRVLASASAYRAAAHGAAASPHKLVHQIDLAAVVLINRGINGLHLHGRFHGQHHILHIHPRLPGDLLYGRFEMLLLIFIRIIDGVVFGLSVPLGVLAKKTL